MLQTKNLAVTQKKQINFFLLKKKKGTDLKKGGKNELKKNPVYGIMGVTFIRSSLLNVHITSVKKRIYLQKR